MGCAPFSDLFKESEKINLTMLLDRSSSMALGSSLEQIEQSVSRAGEWWANEAAKRGGGRFEVFVIGTGFDDLIPIMSETHPGDFPIPVYEHRKRWNEGFKKTLKDSIKRLPINTGSAVIEGTFRVTNRLNESDGEKILIIFSDLRQVTPGVWNFERSVPEPEVFRRWIEKERLRPLFQSNTKVMVYGFKPFPATSTTTRHTSINYDRLRRLWLSIFEDLGVRVSLREEFSLRELEVM